MSNEITIADVRRVKQHLKRKWHSKAWWTFHQSLTVNAVQIVLLEATHERWLSDNKRIAEEASEVYRMLVGYKGK